MIVSYDELDEIVREPEIGILELGVVRKNTRVTVVARFLSACLKVAPEKNKIGA